MYNILKFEFFEGIRPISIKIVSMFSKIIKTIYIYFRFFISIFDCFNILIYGILLKFYIKLKYLIKI